MNVVHFYASNLNGVAEGGIASYVRELLKYPSKQFKHRFVGVTRNHQHWVGTWCQLQIEKCLVDFFPALSVNKDYVTYDKGIPLNAKYLLALFLYRSRILKSADILHFHRVELALPFILFKQRHIPIVLTIHGSARHHELVRSHKLFSKPWFNWLYLRIETLILSRVDRVILVNSEGFNHYTSKFLGIKDKFVMVPTFVDCDEFKPMDKLTSRKNFGLDLNRDIILFVGRLHEQKGLDLLFDAFADLKKDDNDVMLVIAGDGVEKERLICRIKKEKIGNIIFLGGVPHSRLPDLMNCGNLFVLPSLWEGMPIVLLEALACGIPCVATNVGQVSDIMKNGVNGYVVNSRDRVIMKKYISIVLKGNRISSDECRKSVMQYSSERVIRRIEEFYNSVI